MNRENLAFIFFLLTNISLSINCFFYDYAGRKAALAKEERKKEVKPKFKTETVSSFSRIFNQILDVKIDKKILIKLDSLWKTRKIFALNFLI